MRRDALDPPARVAVTAAERDGRLTVHGNRQLAECFPRMFPVPDA